MENIKQHFCDLHENGNSTFYVSDIHSKIPDTAKPISKEKFAELLNGRSEGKLVYIDDSIKKDIQGSHFQLRDRHTKCVNGKWVLDVEVVEEKKKHALIFEARSLLKETDYWDNVSYRSRKSKKQLEQKDLYRNNLRDIINGIGENLPEKP